MAKKQEKCAHWSSIMQRSIAAIDLKLSRKFAFCYENNIIRPVMLLLELSGHGVPWISCTLFALLNVETSSEKEVFLNLFFSLIVDLIVVGILKLCFRRSRPVYNQQDMFLTVSVDNYSFPSGHATRSSMVMVFLITHLNLSMTMKLVIVLWAVSVSFSRIILGRHYVFDVAVGFLVGIMQYFWIIANLWISWSFFNERVLLDYFRFQL